MVMTSFILRKSTSSLVLTMGYSFMFSSLIYTGINQFIKSVGIAKDFDIQKYTLVGNAISLSSHISSEQQRIMLTVCCVGLIVSFLLPLPTRFSYAGFSFCLVDKYDSA